MLGDPVPVLGNGGSTAGSFPMDLSWKCSKDASRVALKLKSEVGWERGHP